MGFFSDLFQGAGSALIGGVSSLVGGAQSNSARRSEATRSGQFNQASAREQMDFQERMSNTAHVRQMDDLKKAGLNPLLSAKYGGASSPGGSSATRPMADQKDFISPAISSALTIQQNQADIALKNAQAANQQAQANRLENIAPITETIGDVAETVQEGIETLKSWDVEKVKQVLKNEPHPLPELVKSVVKKGKKAFNEMTSTQQKQLKGFLDKHNLNKTKPRSGKSRGKINRPKTTRKSTTYEKVWGMPNQIKSGTGRNNPRGRR